MYVNDLLKDQRILITGGGTGLGKTMATRFSELGAKVIIASRKMDILEATAAEIQSATGSTILPLELDVRDYRNVQSVLDTITEKYGGLDGLVNNAAANFISPTEQLSHRAFDVIVDIVLKGTYNCTLALGKQWIEAGEPGTILNIVTTYAASGSGYVVPSSISKAGVLNMTRALAAEWGRKGIRMNAIAPGPIPTEGAWERLIPDPSLEKTMLERIPLGRVGTHEELGNLASFLMSAGSSYINGEVITMDGGEWVAGAGEFNFLSKYTDDEWAEIKSKMKR